MVGLRLEQTATRTVKSDTAFENMAVESIPIFKKISCSKSKKDSYKHHVVAEALADYAKGVVPTHFN